mmetsp:Transcript_86983/g.249473  ORF Transcript_86983/g.249473 Transcript_86983/m.249473 type:complete len:80 (+) Transcript_86983:431-670(+)
MVEQLSMGCSLVFRTTQWRARIRSGEHRGPVADASGSPSSEGLLNTVAHNDGVVERRWVAPLNSLLSEVSPVAARNGAA